MPSRIPIRLLPVARIRPTEHHHVAHVDALVKDMRACALWRVPIVLERDSHAVMDGHHRFQAAQRMGLALAPCLLLDYGQVEVVSRREGLLVTPTEILRRALSGDLYPAKSTRHLFDGPLPLCNISLRVLAA